MKQIYALIMGLMLIPLSGNANKGKLIPTNHPPCTAEIITMSQEVCDDFFAIAATPPEAGETGVWTTPPGTAVIDSNAPTTFIINLASGPNQITWTIFDANGTPCSVASITIINSEVQTIPSVFTNNTETCDEDGFLLEGNQPGLGEVGSWSSNDLTGSVTFANVNSPSTTVNGLPPGNTVVFWNISNSFCDANPAFMTVTNNEVITTAEIEPNVPVIESCITNDFTGVFANITNQLIPGELGTWSSPNPNITFLPNSEAPIISGLASGSNVLIWTISRGNCPSSSDTIIVINNEINIISINTNNGEAACVDESLLLDADPPASNQTGMWSGPAGIFFAPAATSPVVTVFNASVGQQTFTWTITQGSCSASQDVTIEIYPEPVIGNVSVTDVTGGNDGAFNVCINGGTPPYQYDWTPSGGSGMQVAGFCDEQYEISGLTAGTYVLTVTDANGCTDAIITEVQDNATLCPATLYLTGNIAPGIHQAGISIDSDGTVQAGISAGFKAEEIISLLSDFSVELQADFSAEIENCPMLQSEN